MLAGGLNINNVENALSITNAPIIDVSSGVEKEKGIKCERKNKKIANMINFKSLLNFFGQESFNKIKEARLNKKRSRKYDNSICKLSCSENFG